MPTVDRPPLSERKRLQARHRIVQAAEELFSERGFNAVAVADIADRADVGRTTFFRHFGDKQEVVFEQEQELIATIAAAHEESGASSPATAEQAVAQVREIVLALCAQVTEDPESYRRHFAFIEQNQGLRERNALKMQQFAERLAEILLARGADDETAYLASQIGLACYQTAKARSDNDPSRLVTDTREAFARVLRLGAASR